MAQSKFYQPGDLTGLDNASFVEKLLARFFLREDIPARNNPDDLYLRRYHLHRNDSTGEKWCLHVFYRGDEDHDPHDHPWEYESWVLWRSYIDETWEQVGNSRRVVASPVARFGSHIRRPARHMHRVRLLTHGKKVVTLVHMGSKVKPWFFYTENGPVPWRDYNPEPLVVQASQNTRDWLTVMTGHGDIPGALKRLFNR